MEWNKVAPVNRQNPNSVVCVCRLYHIPNKCLRLKVINSPRGIGRELPTDAEPCFTDFVDIYIPGTFLSAFVSMGVMGSSTRTLVTKGVNCNLLALKLL